MTQASKNTFIDQIITVNKKKTYPLPGPGSAFFDKKSARLIDEDKRELLIMKESTKMTKKYNTSQAARTMSFINEKYQKTMPGPGTYPKIEEGKSAPPKKPKEAIKYADFKKSLEEMKKKQKEKMRAEEDRIKVKKAKIGMPEKELTPLPLPADIPTFDHVLKKYGDLKVRMKARMAKSKGKFSSDQENPDGIRGGPGFGTDMRFERDNIKKWKTEVENWNKGIGEGKQLDPKKDKLPGPAQYSTINYYEGKKVKKPFKTKYSGEPHINFKRLSDHAPQLSIYHSQEF